MGSNTYGILIPCIQTGPFNLFSFGHRLIILCMLCIKKRVQVGPKSGSPHSFNLNRDNSCRALFDEEGDRGEGFCKGGGGGAIGGQESRVKT